MPCDRALSAVLDEGDLYLIANTNLHKKYEEEINLKNARNASCEGEHSHDHHESFDLGQGEVSELKNEESAYHKYRLDFLKGFFQKALMK